MGTFSRFAVSRIRNKTCNSKEKNKKRRHRNIDEVIEYIAYSITTNVRELEGATYFTFKHNLLLIRKKLQLI